MNVDSYKTSSSMSTLEIKNIFSVINHSDWMKSILPAISSILNESGKTTEKKNYINLSCLKGKVTWPVEALAKASLLTVISFEADDEFTSGLEAHPLKGLVLCGTCKLLFV